VTEAAELGEPARDVVAVGADDSTADADGVPDREPGPLPLPVSRP
jgi:hypothetical protein